MQSRAKSGAVRCLVLVEFEEMLGRNLALKAQRELSPTPPTDLKATKTYMWEGTIFTRCINYMYRYKQESKGATMRKREPMSLAALVIGLLVLLGFGVSAVVLAVFQPWARCVEEDSSMGCPPAAGGSILLIAGLVVVVASLAALWFAPRIQSNLALRVR